MKALTRLYDLGFKWVPALDSKDISQFTTPDDKAPYLLMFEKTKSIVLVQYLTVTRENFDDIYTAYNTLYKNYINYKLGL
jgi:hypothetical protein